METAHEVEAQFGRGRALLAEAYRQSRVVVRQADVPLDERRLLLSPYDDAVHTSRWLLSSYDDAVHTSRYVTMHSSDLGWLREHHAVMVTLLFLLVAAEQGGQPLGALLPLLPESLASGELRRIYWREQPIAVSLHVDPLPTALHQSQLVGALLAWSRQHPALGLVVSQQAREQMRMGDALPVAALHTSASSVQPLEGSEGGVAE